MGESNWLENVTNQSLKAGIAARVEVGINSFLAMTSRVDQSQEVLWKRGCVAHVRCSGKEGA